MNVLWMGLLWLLWGMAEAATFTTYIIEDKNIDESSGLAASNYSANILWTHNDSGNMPIVYALSIQGKKQGSFFLEGVVNRDWEDMASFRWQGQNYLLIADSGDNFGINLSGYIHIFKEPILAVADPIINDPTSREPAWSIEYEFDDGNLYDIEAVAVDTHSAKIILLSKTSGQVHIFELPLIPASEGGVVNAKKIARINYLRYPSAMDISASGKQAAVLSYGRVYLFSKTAQQTWQEVFKKPDKVIKYKGLFQPEALCFDKKEQHLFLSSEKLPAKLMAIPLP